MALAVGNPANRVFKTQMVRETEAAARALRIERQLVPARSPDELDAAFTAMTEQRADALLVLPDPVFTIHRARIAEFAARARLPAVYGIREAVEAGGLMSYGADYGTLGVQTAAYVDRILKGTRPADLPVEEPTELELVINLRAARALGLATPSRSSCVRTRSPSDGAACRHAPATAPPGYR